MGEQLLLKHNFLKLRNACSADAFVVNQSVVLRINPTEIRDGEYRHLRQTQNRYEVKNLK
jgi:hypothetical protein